MVLVSVGVVQCWVVVGWVVCRGVSEVGGE